MLQHRFFHHLALVPAVAGIVVLAAGCSSKSDEDVGSSEHAESACGIGADPDSTWDAVLDRMEDALEKLP